MIKGFGLVDLVPTDDPDTFTLKRQEVEVVQVDSDRAFVRGTIDTGTQLVSSGVRRLTPGQQVRLKSTANAAMESSNESRLVIDANRGGGAAR